MTKRKGPRPEGDGGACQPGPLAERIGNVEPSPRCLRPYVRSNASLVALPPFVHRCHKKPLPLTGRGAAAPPSRVIPVSLLIEHDGLIHFDERPLDHRLRQSVPLQYLIIKPHQHFELCERRLPKVLV